jgi:hypothetical protein
MDDMRQRYRMPRKDYGLPSQPAAKPAPKPPAPEPASLGLVPDSLKHAYQPPPTPAHHQPAKPEQPRVSVAESAIRRPKAKPKKHLFPKRLLLTVLILGLLSGAGVWAYPKYAHKNPFPADIRSKSAVALFYPSKLPVGYTINANSIHLDNGVLTYAATKNGLRIVFTTQPAPTGFDFQAFIQKYLKNVQPVSTTYGQGFIGQSQDRSLGSMVSGSSWFILSTNNAQVTQDNLRLIMSNLKKY